MQIKLGGLAAFCIGATLIVSCGGGGAGDGATIDNTDNTGVVGAKNANGGAAGNAGGSGGTATSPSAAGAPGTASGTSNTTAGSDDNVPGDTNNPGASSAPSGAPSAAGTTATTPPAATAPAAAPAATGTTPAAAPATTPAAPAATPAAAPAAAPQTGAAAGTIVPLYTYPTDPSWNAVIAAKAAHPRVEVIAAVNPNNGPGAAADPAYASGIARLTAAGIKVIGYVATGYAVNNPGAVKADIDRWRTFYPGQIGGIFFDEQSSRAGDVPYYRDLSQHAKAAGMPFTVGNPGRDTDEAFIGALDTMLIYESSGLPSATQMGGWHSKYAASNFGIIPHTSTFDANFVKNARQYVRYVYVQNDTLPNPWDSVPANFSALLAALE